LVYTDTLGRQLDRQRKRKGRGKRTKEHTNAVTDRRLSDLSDQVLALEMRVARVVQAHAGTKEGVVAGEENSTRELRWALRQLNAATEALHEAAKREAQVCKLLREALEQQEEATAAVRRSDQLRSDVIGVLLFPEDPGQLLE
jgi:hypothetical protein